MKIDNLQLYMQSHCSGMLSSEGLLADYESASKLRGKSNFSDING
ncbi:MULTISPECIES: hypothetical protein [Achromobacter]|nr:hypothetical protein [Achromobacter sp. SD115]